MPILRQQQAADFADLAGARVSATLPVSDRLLSQVIVQRLPAGAPVREFDLRAHPGNRLTVRLRLTRPAFLPAFSIPLTIQQQPDLPRSPVLILQIGSIGGLLSLAGPVLRLLDTLPPGVELQKDRLSVDLRILLEQHGAADALSFLELVEVTTEEGRVILSTRAALPARDFTPSKRGQVP